MRFKSFLLIGFSVALLSAPVASQKVIDRIDPSSIGAKPTARTAALAVQKSDDRIAPRSVELQKKGEAALASGKLLEATDAFETALAVDPRNRAAFVALAKVSQKQKLYGKAIRLTNKALLLDPNDVDAVAVQGEAMVELGATGRAQANLQKLKTLCPQGCPQLTALTNALSRGPTVAAATTPAATSKTN